MKGSYTVLCRSLIKLYIYLFVCLSYSKFLYNCNSIINKNKNNKIIIFSNNTYYYIYCTFSIINL